MNLQVKRFLLKNKVYHLHLQKSFLSQFLKIFRFRFASQKKIDKIRIRFAFAIGKKVKFGDEILQKLKP